MDRKFWIGVAVGFTFVAVWYYYHMRCPACQEKWKRVEEQVKKVFNPPSAPPDGDSLNKGD